MASAVVSDNFETGSGGVPQLGGTGATTCKAWVNFNGGGSTGGTVAIRSSYNVSSITDHSVGNYTANFTVGVGSNPSATVSADLTQNYGDGIAGLYYGEPGNNGCRVRSYRSTMGGTQYDLDVITIQVFGTA
jgi:hypothetical protein